MLSVVAFDEYAGTLEFRPNPSQDLGINPSVFRAKDTADGPLLAAETFQVYNRSRITVPNVINITLKCHEGVFRLQTVGKFTTSVSH